MKMSEEYSRPKSRSNSSVYLNQHYQNLITQIRQKNQEQSVDEPTVKEHLPFDPKADSEILFNSMKGLGTHERMIIDVLTQRSNKQRQDIATVYRETYGKDIIKAFKGELKIIINGHFEDVIVALFKQHEFYDAELIHHAVSGMSTDEDVLIDVVCSRDNKQLEAIKKAYLLHYGKDLIFDIDKQVHASSAFKKLLIAVLAGSRESDEDVNAEQARWDARAMYDAGPKHWASDEAFLPIFAGRSYAHLRHVIAEFEQIADLEIDKVVGRELHGDVGHLLESLAKFAKNKNSYFAELIHKSLKGMGTNHKRLIRTIVSRCEIDMGNISDKYELMYHRSLGSAIAIDTSGNYRNILLALINCQEELRKHEHTHRPSSYLDYSFKS